ncbi:class C beta-lactamase [Psychrobacter sp. DAB_AL62B]|uniref:class C beta-lactamase n=1 Tax=Psychrobacter sp. DAB_AL62B TaxID=1028420 RepID=UPI00238136BA|nr:class C beta-lactamase [Psychrobacter sp. DAB_AL62B]MDE4454856.1 beta-lactamase [Psychrobacter sp. DAB_AL62B]
MKKSVQTTLNRVGLTALVVVSLTSGAVQAADSHDRLKSAVDQQAKLLMDEHNIPGMSFGVIIDGKSYFYHYGLADKKARKPVSENTIFELGSISKTFTATAASYAELNGQLSINDSVDKYIPYLTDSPIGNTKLINLATYTAGGLPLQVPDEVKNNKELLRYYKSWQPVFPVNSKRLYSNASIGLFGYISALSMGSDYTSLMENKILPSLSMPNTFVNVPSDRMADYAFGYNAAGEPIRVNPGILDAEAYGIKSTSADMTHFMAANMGLVPLDKDIQQALDNNRKGYYQASTFIQGLAWEMYQFPTKLETLLEGNSAEVVLKPQTITTDNHPIPILNNVWVNKTGATNGFGGYIAYIPTKKTGIVILANKNYPNADRIKAAYTILESAMTH